MKKCSCCSKLYPEAILKNMVRVIGNKAYEQKVCPSCQSVIANNPNYYYFEKEKESSAEK